MATIKIPAQKLELGAEVKDPVTGLKGIVTCIAYMLNSGPRVAVQPQGLTKDQDTKPQKFFDWERLTTLPIPEEPEPKYLGKKKHDSLIPEKKGIVIARHVNFMGCQFVELQPEALKPDGSVQESHIFDLARVAPPEKGKTEPGGPAVPMRAR